MSAAGGAPSKAEIDTAERRELRGGRSQRPRDAATLILIDGHGADAKVLMGRRHMRHAFMPGKFVFPGGRTDAADSRVATSTPLHSAELAKLLANSRIGENRARAIALSAVRETYEEAGLLIGRRGGFSARAKDWQGFVENGVHPSLENLRFIARAITPPNRVRRFDTRFFAARRDDVAVALPNGPTNELEELVWLSFGEAKQADIPLITKAVLENLEARLRDDPQLAPGGAVPFYRMVGGEFIREFL